MQVSKTILLVDDEPGIRKSLSTALKDEGYQVLRSDNGEKAIDLISGPDGEAVDLVLLDVWLPGLDGLKTLQELKKIQPELPVIMISGHGTVNTALEATKHGAFDFLEKPIDLERLLLVSSNAIRQSKLERENKRLKSLMEQERFFIADSPIMRDLLSSLTLISASNGRVLITGENGTGKEDIARLIHQKSARAQGPFIEVNCASISDELIESELFGHVRGSFPGALKDARGRFREADGGTLFLDEIGDMSLRTQAKVLRALQEGQIEPLGSEASVTVDCRVIASTNKDLGELIKQGQFREDLYFRLAVVPLRVPSLRERPEDILPLSELFIKQIAKHYGKSPKALTPEARSILTSHDWPGNVRELKNLMERAMILCRTPEIHKRDLLPLPSRQIHNIDPFSFPEFATLKDARDWFEKIYLEREIQLQKGNMTRVAEKAGVDRSNLYKRLKALGIEHREN